MLVAKTDQQIHGGASTTELSQAQSDSSACENKKDSNRNGHYDCCDILMAPRLMESENVSTANDVNGDLIKISKDTTLTAIQQSVVLAQCLHLSRINRDDELSSRFIYLLNKWICINLLNHCSKVLCCISFSGLYDLFSLTLLLY